MINPYKISQEILKTHLVLNSLTYDLFDSLAGADRVRLNDCYWRKQSKTKRIKTLRRINR